MNPAAMLRLASAITDISTPVLVSKLAGKTLDRDSYSSHNNQTRQGGST